MITLTYDLNIYPDRVPQVVHLSQYDTDFELVFNLFSSFGEFTVEQGTYAEIRFTKPDGNGYSARGTIDGTSVTFAGDDQMTPIAGQFPAEVTLFSVDDKELSTVNFVMDVERSPMDGSTISDSDIEELNALIRGASVIPTEQFTDVKVRLQTAENDIDTLETITTSQGTRLTDAEGAIDDLQTDLRYVYAPNDDITGASFNKNFLLVGTPQADQAALFNSSNLSGEFTNVPPALSGVTVASGIRRTETLAQGYVYVRVEEFYPVNGRIHTNFLEGGSTWRGWHTTDPVGITPIERGGTGSNTVAGVLTNLGLTTKTGTFTLSVSGNNNFVVKQFGNVVTMSGYANNMSISANTDTRIGTVSGVSLPSDNVRFKGAVGQNAWSPGNDAYVVVGPNGGVNLNSTGAGTTVYFSVTWIAG